jgi:hypothetical protein
VPERAIEIYRSFSLQRLKQSGKLRNGKLLGASAREQSRVVENPFGARSEPGAEIVPQRLSLLRETFLHKM